MTLADASLFPYIAVGVLGVAFVLAVLIRALAAVRLEEVRMIRKGTLTDSELDALAEKLAARLARPDHDRKLLLDLAKMTEHEFLVYREALRVERDGAAKDAPDRKRELA